jgi:hypothetical protein
MANLQLENVFFSEIFLQIRFCHDRIDLDKPSYDFVCHVKSLLYSSEPGRQLSVRKYKFPHRSSSVSEGVTTFWKSTVVCSAGTYRPVVRRERKKQ